MFRCVIMIKRRHRAHGPNAIRQTFPEQLRRSHYAFPKVLGNQLAKLTVRSSGEVNSLMEWPQSPCAQHAYDSNYDSPARPRGSISSGQQTSKSMIRPDNSPRLIFSQPVKQVHSHSQRKIHHFQDLQPSRNLQKSSSQKIQLPPLPSIRSPD